MGDMFLHNQWGWFHALGGGALTWLFMLLYGLTNYFRAVFLTYGYKRAALFSTMTVALLWEIGEYYLTTFGQSPKFFADSLGDMILAMIGAVIAVLCAEVGENYRRR